MVGTLVRMAVDLGALNFEEGGILKMLPDFESHEIQPARQIRQTRKDFNDENHEPSSARRPQTTRLP